MHPRGEISKKLFPIGFMVCGLLLASVPLSDAAQNPKGSTQTPSAEKSKENDKHNVDAAPTIEKTQSPKIDPSIDPSSTPKAESKGDSNKTVKADTGKKADPQSRLTPKPAKIVKPVGKKSAKPDHSDKGKANTELKKIDKNVKDVKEKSVKAEKSAKADEKLHEEVTATVTTESTIKVEEGTATPGVSLSPSPQPAGLSAEIEKSNGNKATLVVSGVKEGTKVKVVITNKDSKKK